MKEFKGTEKDWIFNTDNNIYPEIINEHNYKDGVSQLKISVYLFSGNRFNKNISESDENSANIKLIIAAKSLLNELQKTRRTLIESGFTENSSTLIGIDKALNKAL